ncbi:MAG: Gfo/Idh/MocA family oxidoreductase [Rikenellaceae bacterium]
MKKYLLYFLVIFLLSCEGKKSGMISFPEQSRLSGQADVIELACDPVDTVDIAVIGLEMGGIEAVRRLSLVNGARIKAIFDIVPENIAKALAVLKKLKRPPAEEYDGEEEWRNICERDDIDLIYICAPQYLHATMAVFAMENGKHVATEAPAALTLDECWDIVNTAEKTRRHLIMLEKSCYDRYEMAILNMAQQGFFGEVMSIESGDINPTFGIGPAAQILNIHRGDKMNYLLSVSGANNTIIKTEMGKTMLIRNDSVSSRPYIRTYNIRGTNAFAQKNPANLRDSVLKAYEHPIVKEFRKKDLIMDSRLIYCLQNGLPLDMDVYDAAEWSSVVVLGKVSAEHNGKPVWIPDFTRRSWDKIKGYKQYKNDK